jgi:glycosyltransferase involved in cell wall biosynthesis
MHLVLVADTFPPQRSSGAVQLRDLTREFIKRGHLVSVILPTSSQIENWSLENFEGAQVLRVKAPRTKEVGKVRRTLAEILMPFYMLKNYRQSPFASEKWDAVLWYSPSIFHGPFVYLIKKNKGLVSYLIIRDIFPEWAVDVGLLNRGLTYMFFLGVARFQYSIADVIGIQTLGNQKYFKDWLKRPGRRLEVLQNWLDEPSNARCSIQLNKSVLVGRRIFVYAGNMGIAQRLEIVVDLAMRLIKRIDIGFLFVGRGSSVKGLKDLVSMYKLNNVLFLDEIDPDEIPDLYAQCTAGLVVLDPKHKSHNIPGKFITYMQNGLPVLAIINEGNDLASVIRAEEVGQVCESRSIEEIERLTEYLLEQIDRDPALSSRCVSLFKREFSVQRAVNQIIDILAEKLVESK